MSNMLEAARNVLRGIKLPVQPLPVESKPIYTTIIRASGIGRERLLDECRQILGQKEITPDGFLNFTANMVDLIGGIKSEFPADNSEDKSSNYIPEPKTEYALSVKRFSWNPPHKLEYGCITMQPLWTVIQEKEAIERWKNCSDPVAVERLVYGHTGPFDSNGEPIPTIEPYFPPNFQPSLKLEMLEKPVPTLPLIDSKFPIRITKEEMIIVCRRAFSAVEQRR